MSWWGIPFALRPDEHGWYDEVVAGVVGVVAGVLAIIGGVRTLLAMRRVERLERTFDEEYEDER